MKTTLIALTLFLTACASPNVTKVCAPDRTCSQLFTHEAGAFDPRTFTYVLRNQDGSVIGYGGFGVTPPWISLAAPILPAAATLGGAAMIGRGAASIQIGQ